jgi:hypothetical protein
MSASSAAGHDNAHHDPEEQRKAQWLYLIPVVFAPTAHIIVNAAQKAAPRTRRLLLAGAAAATAGAVWQRVWLMDHAGYPGSEGSKSDDRWQRVPPRLS